LVLLGNSLGCSTINSQALNNQQLGNSLGSCQDQFPTFRLIDLFTSFLS
jgi:hypothetical protein